MIAIVKYNAGNIYSVYCACRRLGFEAVITDDPAELRSATHVIFPGVGEARSAMTYLNERTFPTANGGSETLADVIRSLRQPVLGICIGMQLMCSHSEEGDVECLGIFPVRVERFHPSDPSLKVPQVGWNQIAGHDCELFNGVASGAFVYYVHSYRVALCPYTISQTEYGESYSAALHHQNFWATQFHPEKSGTVGEQILQNFLNL